MSMVPTSESPAHVVPVIDVANLTRRYRRTVAVDDVSLQITLGEIVGLLGPDGAGKSTVLQVLAGVLVPHSGRVTVAAIDVLRDPEALKARIGYMPQGLGANLYDDLTVDEHLQFFAELRGVPAAAFREHRVLLLETTQLTAAAGRLARQLSGGMRQKLGLICAIIHLPDVLLLDEPTTGVDPLSRQDFWHIINRLSRERQITVLLTTPYLDEAERCHRVALMNRGRLLAVGPPEELKARLDRNAPEPTSMEDVFISLLAAAGGSTGAAVPRAAEAPLVPHRSNIGQGPAIIAEELTKYFGDTAAVSGVSFTIGAGEIFGFLGPNGAGKTTTIKMLTGILRPTRGRGFVAGYDVLQQVGMVKRTIGYMSQRFSLYPDLTVRENLGLFARIYGLAGVGKRDREEAVIAAVELDEWRGVLARDLPLGIRQRLALAGSLLHKPPILFLDEPTSGVDPVARRRFWDLITGLSREQRVTIVISTHYMDEAIHCDRLALMHRGVLVALDSPAMLRRLATERQGSVLEVTATRFRDAFSALERHFTGLSLAGSRIHVFTQNPFSDRLQISQVLDHLGAGGAGIREVPMAMDDVFATLIGGRR